jgi:Spy/CpxP family protein refolding chaperone
MKTKIICIAAAVAILAGGFITTTSRAEGNAATASAPLRGQMFKRIAERLNLTDDQKSQIKAILSGEKDSLKTLLGQLHDARTNLRTAIQAADANETSVRAAAARVASAEADLAVERMKLFGKIAPILTDEQRQKISEISQRLDEFSDNVIAHIGDGLAE